MWELCCLLLSYFFHFYTLWNSRNAWLLLHPIRLKYICSTEGYKTNARALTALAEHTGTLLVQVFWNWGMYIRAKWVYCSSDVLIFFLVAWIVFVCPSLYMWVWNFLAIDASPLLYRVRYTVLPQHSSIPQQKEAFPEDGLYSPFCVQPCSIFWKHFATSLAVHNLTVINAWVLLVGGLAKLLLWDLVFAGGCGLTGDWSERHDKQHFWHLGRGQHHGLQCFQTACCYAMCKNLGCIPFVHLKLLRELHWYLSCWRYFKGKRCAKELWFRG